MYQEMGCGIVDLQKNKRFFSSLICMVAYYSGESEATRKGTRAKMELDWLSASVSLVPKHDRGSSSATGYWRSRLHCVVEVGL